MVGINVDGATDFVLSYSTLSNSGGDLGAYCTANLGIGRLLRADIHHLTITAPTGMAIKQSSVFQVSQDVDIHDSVFDAQTSTCSSWSTLSVELWWTAINCQLRNNRFTRILSLPEGGVNGDPGGGRYRWRIHHNDFDIPPSLSNQYSIELGIDYTEVDHNFIHWCSCTHSGTSTWGTCKRTSRFTTTSSSSHMDKPRCGTTCGRYFSTSIYKNTVAMREPASTYTDGVLCFGEQKGYPNDSTGSFNDNIVYAVYAVGDKMGKGIGAFTFAGNAFYNITPRGTNFVTAHPNMPLSGGFPAAYVPSGTPATRGAMADGTFTVGPTP